ncbi:MAG TPA: SMC-Scp complex subunit ScpB, partial [Gemmataceae bacterium]|nr:SMC-Scp complex subunit ScpB [Gemmataceae bacterium]
MFQGWTPRTLAPDRPAHMSGNHPLPPVHRLLGDLGEDRAASDPAAREPALALVEAALLIADEPLPLRKLVQI